MPDNDVPLKEYIELWFRKHEERHTRESAETQRNLQEARNEINRRLEGLNELRQEVTEDRAQLVQQAAFDVKIEAIEDKISNNQTAVSNIIIEMAAQRGRATAFAVLGTVLLILIPLVVQYLLK